MKTSLPLDSQERKDTPVYTGCMMYFPAALAGVARHSKRGNDKHNPGQPLHHSRGKSGDHGDCVARHIMDIGDMLATFERQSDPFDSKALLEEADALCWRALALSQELYERFGKVPLAPAAKAAPELPRAGSACPYCKMKLGERHLTGCSSKKDGALVSWADDLVVPVGTTVCCGSHPGNPCPVVLCDCKNCRDTIRKAATRI